MQEFDGTKFDAWLTREPEALPVEQDPNGADAVDNMDGLRCDGCNVVVGWTLEGFEDSYGRELERMGYRDYWLIGDDDGRLCEDCFEELESNLV